MTDPFFRSLPEALRPVRWIFAALALLVTLTVLLGLMGSAHVDALMMLVMVLLGVTGIFALYGLSSGLLRFQLDKHGSGAEELLKKTALPSVLTDFVLRPLIANAAYTALVTRQDMAVPLLSDVFAGHPGLQESLYRITQKAHKQGFADEVLSLAQGRRAGEPLRLQALHLEGVGFLWSLVPAQDVSVTQPLGGAVMEPVAVQHLDQCPLAFLAVSLDGRVAYANAPLAQLVGRSLHDFLGGALLIEQLVGKDSALLFHSRMTDPRDAVVLDVDLYHAAGHRMPVKAFTHAGTGAGGEALLRVILVPELAFSRDAGHVDVNLHRLSRFFNQAPLSIASLDRSGKLVRCNPGFRALYHQVSGLDAIKGALVQSMFEGGSLTPWQTLLTSLHTKASGETQSLDVQLAGETPRYARLFVSLLGGGELTADAGDDEDVVLYLIETTEQKTLEAQFAQSQKMQAVGQLAGGIAHDFNNLLTAIIGYADLLLTQHRPSDPSFQDIWHIRNSAVRAAALVRQLLAFSRKQTLRPQSLQLTEVLTDFSYILNKTLGEKVKLDVRHARDLWLVKADVNQLEQVIMNLVVNARDAMPEGGSILVSTRNLSGEEAQRFDKAVPDQPFVLIEVVDQGTGMPKEIQDKIFEPFFTTKEVGKGTGLGLSTVYGIVKQTGGFIFCRSALGEGTTFSILLPKHEPEPQELAAPVAATASAPQDMTGHGTILLVEDEEGVRALGARALRARGYTVLEAGTGVEALEQMQDNEGKVDMVVSDVVMPEMDGPTLLRELRQRYPGIKFVFVSGYAEDAFRKNLGDEDNFGFLPKPFAIKDLIEKVKSTLAA